LNTHLIINLIVIWWFYLSLLSNNKYDILISVFLYWEPDILGNSDSQIIANPLITPNSILPEWYYLLFYSRPRSSPNKSIGVILVLLLVLYLISYFNWIVLIRRALIGSPSVEVPGFIGSSYYISSL